MGGVNEVIRPGAHIQWKGTDACLDIYCACGANLHFDGLFAYELTCGVCGKVWEMPKLVPLSEVTGGSDYPDNVLHPE